MHIIQDIIVLYHLTFLYKKTLYHDYHTITMTPLSSGGDDNNDNHGVC